MRNTATEIRDIYEEFEELSHCDLDWTVLLDLEDLLKLVGDALASWRRGDNPVRFSNPMKRLQMFVDSGPFCDCLSARFGVDGGMEWTCPRHRKMEDK